MRDEAFDRMVGQGSSPVKEPSADTNPWLDPAMMAKVQEAVDKAVRVASEALPLVEEQRRKILDALQKVDTAIAKLRAVIDSKDVTATSSEANSASDPAAGKDVEVILYEAEEPLKVNEIIDRIKTKFGNEWASSTVYGHLTKLKTKDVVVNAGGRWSMTEGGRDTVVF